MTKKTKIITETVFGILLAGLIIFSNGQIQSKLYPKVTVAKASSGANTYALRFGQEINIDPQLNQTELDAYIEEFAHNFDRAPVNASLSISNGILQLSPSQNGRSLDREKLKNDLLRLINSGKTHGKILITATNLEPAITSSATLTAQRDARIYLRTAPINVTFDNSEWTASRTDIGNWISFSESDGKLVTLIDPSSFVNSIAREVTIPAQDSEIREGSGEIIKEGQDGRSVDTNALTNQINDALTHGRPNRTFALATSIVPHGQKIISANAQAGRFAGRYIDINLSEQTLYAFEGASLLNQFLISSGRSGYATPTGEFNIYSKSRSNLMSGPGYYLPNVPWISRFAPGPISIHGTYWHSNFGTPMSHGCINASIPDAEWVYNFVDIGTPVYVHY